MERKNNLDILEIGGGYGGLCRIFMRSGRVRSYVIVDLPESLMCAYAYLRLSIPDRKCVLIESADSFALNQSADVRLVPLHLLDVIDGLNVDLAVNTGSFGEMPRSTMLTIMNVIQRRVKVDYLYSVNYAFQLRGRHPEKIASSAEEENLVSVEFDDGWDLVRFRINPPVVYLDSRRGWLEVLMRRSRTAQDRSARASSGVTQESLGQLWQALWKNPDEETIRQFLDDLRAVFEQKSEDNILVDFKLADKFRDIGETEYWYRRLAQPSPGPS